MAEPEVDIGDGCRRIENEQENLRRGHSVRDSMENTNPISGDENLYFESTFDFDCPEMPTSFHFRITFKRSVHQVIKSVASVRRTDQRAGFVNVRLRARVYRNGTKVASTRYGISDLEPGSVKSEVCYIVLEECASSLQLEQNLLVAFVLTVEGCHSEKEGEEAMDSQDSKDSSPKKRLRVQSSS